MSRSKQKGTAAETAVVKYLKEWGWPVDRQCLKGAADEGDIAGLPHCVIEVKNCQQMALAAWLDEAETERVNAGKRFGVVWHKRRGKGHPRDWYVTMDGDTFVSMYQYAMGGSM